MPRKVSEDFPFVELVGREFVCTKNGIKYMVTADDHEESKKDYQRTSCSDTPYWDIPCPGCGGKHQFFPGTAIHIEPD